MGVPASSRIRPQIFDRRPSDIQNPDDSKILKALLGSQANQKDTQSQHDYVSNPDFKTYGNVQQPKFKQYQSEYKRQIPKSRHHQHLTVSEKNKNWVSSSLNYGVVLQLFDHGVQSSWGVSGHSTYHVEPPEPLLMFEQSFTYVVLHGPDVQSLSVSQYLFQMLQLWYSSSLKELVFHLIRLV